jgi:hypothetical protein
MTFHLTETGNFSHNICHFLHKYDSGGGGVSTDCFARQFTVPKKQHDGRAKQDVRVSHFFFDITENRCAPANLYGNLWLVLCCGNTSANSFVVEK